MFDSHRPDYISRAVARAQQRLGRARALTAGPTLEQRVASAERVLAAHGRRLNAVEPLIGEIGPPSAIDAITERLDRLERDSTAARLAGRDRRTMLALGLASALALEIEQNPLAGKPAKSNAAQFTTLIDEILAPA